MKKSALLLAAAAIGLAASAQDAPAPAFPGAEGHGRYVVGGRGGKVIHVTNLNDSGEGSLRQALNTDGARIIVFDVGGTIELKSNLTFSKDKVTVMGQTAPFPGITVAYYTAEPKGNNVIFRYIRFRRSQVKDVNDGADALFTRNRYYHIYDHCSFSWSIDEVCSVYDNRDFTLQWCCLGEGLCNPGHSKGAHSYGGIWGGKDASFLHNFIAHVSNRAPRFNGARYKWGGFNKETAENTVQGEHVDFRNCVIYNWGNGNGCYGGPGGGYINMVNNYYKAGPGTSAKTRVTQVTVGASGNSSPADLYGYTSRYYINGNYVAAASEPENYDWNGVVYDSGTVTINGEKYMKDAAHLYGDGVEYVQSGGVDCVKIKLDEPIPYGTVTTHTAQVAYDKVLNYMGACLYRDAVDARYAEEARTGTVTYNGDVPFVDATGKTFPKSGQKGIPDWVNDPASEIQNPGVPSFPYLAPTKHPEGWDTDGDGMPDWWEEANGLDPNDPSDSSLYTIDTEREWYTNIEVYCNYLVEKIARACIADGEGNTNEYFPSYKLPAGVESPTVSSEIVGVEYYNLQGIRVAEPAEQGVTIRRITYGNGTVSTDKVVKKL